MQGLVGWLGRVFQSRIDLDRTNSVQVGWNLIRSGSWCGAQWTLLGPTDVGIGLGRFGWHQHKSGKVSSGEVTSRQIWLESGRIGSVCVWYFWGPMLSIRIRSVRVWSDQTVRSSLVLSDAVRSSQVRDREVAVDCYVSRNNVRLSKRQVEFGLLKYFRFADIPDTSLLQLNSREEVKCCLIRISSDKSGKGKFKLSVK
jgi:hypothetical protein